MDLTIDTAVPSIWSTGGSGPWDQLLATVRGCDTSTAPCFTGADSQLRTGPEQASECISIDSTQPDALRTVVVTRGGTILHSNPDGTDLLRIAYPTAAWDFSHRFVHKRSKILHRKKDSELIVEPLRCVVASDDQQFVVVVTARGALWVWTRVEAGHQVGIWIPIEAPYAEKKLTSQRSSVDVRLHVDVTKHWCAEVVCSSVAYAIVRPDKDTQSEVQSAAAVSIDTIIGVVDLSALADAAQARMNAILARASSTAAPTTPLPSALAQVTVTRDKGNDLLSTSGGLAHVPKLPWSTSGQGSSASARIDTTGVGGVLELVQAPFTKPTGDAAKDAGLTQSSIRSYIIYATARLQESQQAVTVPLARPINLDDPTVTALNPPETMAMPTLAGNAPGSSPLIQRLAPHARVGSSNHPTAPIAFAINDPAPARRPDQGRAAAHGGASCLVIVNPSSGDTGSQHGDVAWRPRYDSRRRQLFRPSGAVVVPLSRFVLLPPLSTSDEGSLDAATLPHTPQDPDTSIMTADMQWSFDGELISGLTAAGHFFIVSCDGLPLRVQCAAGLSQYLYGHPSHPASYTLPMFDHEAAVVIGGRVQSHPTPQEVTKGGKGSKADKREPPRRPLKLRLGSARGTAVISVTNGRQHLAFRLLSEEIGDTDTSEPQRETRLLSEMGRAALASACPVLESVPVWKGAGNGDSFEGVDESDGGSSMTQSVDGRDGGGSYISAASIRSRAARSMLTAGPDVHIARSLANQLMAQNLTSSPAHRRDTAHVSHPGPRPPTTVLNWQQLAQNQNMGRVDVDMDGRPPDWASALYGSMELARHVLVIDPDPVREAARKKKVVASAEAAERETKGGKSSGGEKRSKLHSLRNMLRRNRSAAAHVTPPTYAAMLESAQLVFGAARLQHVMRHADRAGVFAACSRRDFLHHILANSVTACGSRSKPHPTGVRLPVEIGQGVVAAAASHIPAYSMSRVRMIALLMTQLKAQLSYFSNTCLKKGRSGRDAAGTDAAYVTELLSGLHTGLSAVLSAIVAGDMAWTTIAERFQLRPVLRELILQVIQAGFQASSLVRGGDPVDVATTAAVMLNTTNERSLVVLVVRLFRYLAVQSSGGHTLQFSVIEFVVRICASVAVRLRRLRTAVRILGLARQFAAELDWPRCHWHPMTYGFEGWENHPLTKPPPADVEIDMEPRLREVKSLYHSRLQRTSRLIRARASASIAETARLASEDLSSFYPPDIVTRSAESLFCVAGWREVYYTTAMLQAAFAGSSDSMKRMAWSLASLLRRKHVPVALPSAPIWGSLVSAEDRAMLGQQHPKPGRLEERQGVLTTVASAYDLQRANDTTSAWHEAQSALMQRQPQRVKQLLRHTGPWRALGDTVLAIMTRDFATALRVAQHSAAQLQSGAAVPPVPGASRLAVSPQQYVCLMVGMLLADFFDRPLVSPMPPRRVGQAELGNDQDSSSLIALPRSLYISPYLYERCHFVAELYDVPTMFDHDVLSHLPECSRGEVTDKAAVQYVPASAVAGATAMVADWCPGQAVDLLRACGLPIATQMAVHLCLNASAPVTLVSLRKHHVSAGQGSVTHASKARPGQRGSGVQRVQSREGSSRLKRIGSSNSSVGTAGEGGIRHTHVTSKVLVQVFPPSASADPPASPGASDVESSSDEENRGAPSRAHYGDSTVQCTLTSLLPQIRPYLPPGLNRRSLVTRSVNELAELATALSGLLQGTTVSALKINHALAVRSARYFDEDLWVRCFRHRVRVCIYQQDLAALPSLMALAYDVLTVQSMEHLRSFILDDCITRCTSRLQQLSLIRDPHAVALEVHDRTQAIATGTGRVNTPRRLFHEPEYLSGRTRVSDEIDASDPAGTEIASWIPVRDEMLIHIAAASLMDLAKPGTHQASPRNGKPATQREGSAPRASRLSKQASSNSRVKGEGGCVAVGKETSRDKRVRVKAPEGTVDAASLPPTTSVFLLNAEALLDDLMLLLPVRKPPTEGRGFGGKNHDTSTSPASNVSEVWSEGRIITPRASDVNRETARWKCTNSIQFVVNHPYPNSSTSATPSSTMSREDALAERIARGLADDTGGASVTRVVLPTVAWYSATGHNHQDMVADELFLVIPSDAFPMFIQPWLAQLAPQNPVAAITRSSIHSKRSLARGAGMADDSGSAVHIDTGSERRMDSRRFIGSWEAMGDGASRRSDGASYSRSVLPWLGTESQSVVGMEGADVLLTARSRVGIVRTHSPASSLAQVVDRCGTTDMWLWRQPGGDDPEYLASLAAEQPADADMDTSRTLPHLSRLRRRSSSGLQRAVEAKGRRSQLDATAKASEGLERAADLLRFEQDVQVELHAAGKLAWDVLQLTAAMAGYPVHAMLDSMLMEGCATPTSIYLPTSGPAHVLPDRLALLLQCRRAVLAMWATTVRDAASLWVAAGGIGTTSNLTTPFGASFHSLFSGDMGAAGSVRSHRDSVDSTPVRGHPAGPSQSVSPASVASTYSATSQSDRSMISESNPSFTAPSRVQSGSPGSRQRGGGERHGGGGVSDLRRTIASAALAKAVSRAGRSKSSATASYVRGIHAWGSKDYAKKLGQPLTWDPATPEYTLPSSLTRGLAQGRRSDDHRRSATIDGSDASASSDSTARPHRRSISLVKEATQQTRQKAAALSVSTRTDSSDPDRDFPMERWGWQIRTARELKRAAARQICCTAGRLAILGQLMYTDPSLAATPSGPSAPAQPATRVSEALEAQHGERIRGLQRVALHMLASVASVAPDDVCTVLCVFLPLDGMKDTEKPLYRRVRLTAATAYAQWAALGLGLEEQLDPMLHRLVQIVEGSQAASPDRSRGASEYDIKEWTGRWKFVSSIARQARNIVAKQVQGTPPSETIGDGETLNVMSAQFAYSVCLCDVEFIQFLQCLHHISSPIRLASSPSRSESASTPGSPARTTSGRVVARHGDSAASGESTPRHTKRKEAGRGDISLTRHDTHPARKSVKGRLRPKKEVSRSQRRFCSDDRHGGSRLRSPSSSCSTGSEGRDSSATPARISSPHSPGVRSPLRLPPAQESASASRDSVLSEQREGQAAMQAGMITMAKSRAAVEAAHKRALTAQLQGYLQADEEDDMEGDVTSYPGSKRASHTTGPTRISPRHSTDSYGSVTLNDAEIRQLQEAKEAAQHALDAAVAAMARANAPVERAESTSSQASEESDGDGSHTPASSLLSPFQKAFNRHIAALDQSKQAATHSRDLSLDTSFDGSASAASPSPRSPSPQARRPRRRLVQSVQVRHSAEAPVRVPKLSARVQSPELSPLRTTMFLRRSAQSTPQPTSGTNSGTSTPGSAATGAQQASEQASVPATANSVPAANTEPTVVIPDRPTVQTDLTAVSAEDIALTADVTEALPPRVQSVLNRYLHSDPMNLGHQPTSDGHDVTMSPGGGATRRLYVYMNEHDSTPQLSTQPMKPTSTSSIPRHPSRRRATSTRTVPSPTGSTTSRRSNLSTQSLSPARYLKRQADAAHAEVVGMANIPGAAQRYLNNTTSRRRRSLARLQMAARQLGQSHSAWDTDIDSRDLLTCSTAPASRSISKDRLHTAAPLDTHVRPHRSLSLEESLDIAQAKLLMADPSSRGMLRRSDRSAQASVAVEPLVPVVPEQEPSQSDTPEVRSATPEATEGSGRVDIGVGTSPSLGPEAPPTVPPAPAVQRAPEPLAPVVVNIPMDMTDPFDAADEADGGEHRSGRRLLGMVDISPEEFAQLMAEVDVRKQRAQSSRSQAPATAKSPSAGPSDARTDVADAPTPGSDDAAKETPDEVGASREEEEGKALVDDATYKALGRQEHLLGMESQIETEDERAVRRMQQHLDSMQRRIDQLAAAAAEAVEHEKEENDEIDKIEQAERDAVLKGRLKSLTERAALLEQRCTGTGKRRHARPIELAPEPSTGSRDRADEWVERVLASDDDEVTTHGEDQEAEARARRARYHSAARMKAAMAESEAEASAADDALRAYDAGAFGRASVMAVEDVTPEDVPPGGRKPRSGSVVVSDENLIEARYVGAVRV